MTAPEPRDAQSGVEEVLAEREACVDPAGWSEARRERGLWARVNKTEGCWLWTGGITTSGYGQLEWYKKRVSAHRLIYEMLAGPIPAGLVLDHLCRVRHCVNPAHLEPVTVGENNRRGVNGKNVDTCRKGVHPWPEARSLDSHGKWECRECARDRNRRAAARYRARRTEQGAHAPAVAPASTTTDPRATEGERGRESGDLEEGE